MFIARLVCSDSDCAEESELHADSRAELERLICDCGCALELVAWPDWAEDVAEVVAIRRRRPVASAVFAAA